MEQMLLWKKTAKLCLCNEICGRLKQGFLLPPPVGNELLKTIAPKLAASLACVFGKDKIVMDRTKVFQKKKKIVIWL